MLSHSYFQWVEIVDNVEIPDWWVDRQGEKEAEWQPHWKKKEVRLEEAPNIASPVNYNRHWPIKGKGKRPTFGGSGQEYMR